MNQKTATISERHRPGLIIAQGKYPFSVPVKRASVLECGTPVPLWIGCNFATNLATVLKPKRHRSAALQGGCAALNGYQGNALGIRTTINQALKGRPILPIFAFAICASILLLLSCPRAIAQNTAPKPNAPASRPAPTTPRADKIQAAFDDFAAKNHITYNELDSKGGANFHADSIVEETSDSPAFMWARETACEEAFQHAASSYAQLVQTNVDMQNKDGKFISTRTATGPISGIVPVRTFEIDTGDGHYAVGVVLKTSAATRQIAYDMDKGRPPTVKRNSGQSLAEVLPRDSEMFGEFGVRIFFDEKGEPALLSIAQKSLAYEGANETLRKRAEQQASEQAASMAAQSIQTFLNAIIAFKSVTTEDDFVQDIKITTLGKASGIRVVYNKILKHPSGHPVAIAACLLTSAPPASPAK